MMGSSHLAAYLTKGQKTGIKTDKRKRSKKKVQTSLLFLMVEFLPTSEQTVTIHTLKP